MVVAVPISIIISGAPYSLRPATASTIRSAPADDGSSMATLIPVLTPGPTNRGVKFSIFFTAAVMTVFTWGTTDDTATPSMLSTLTL